MDVLNHPNNHTHTRTIRLEPYISWSILLTSMLIILVFLWNDQALGTDSVGSLILVSGTLILQIIVRLLVHRERTYHAILLMCTGLLVIPLVGAIITPDLHAILMLLPLLAVMVGLPVLTVQGVRRLIISAWLVIVICVLTNLRIESGYTPLFEGLAEAFSIVFVMALVVLMLWQYHRRLFRLLASSRAANESLVYVQSNLESQVLARMAELQEREARYRSISNLTSDYVFSLETQASGGLRIEWITDAFERITGYTPDELMQSGGWMTIVHPDDMPIATAHAERVLDGMTDVCEHRIITRDGETRWLRIYGQLLSAGSGDRGSRILGAAQDITEQKRLAEADRRLAEQRHRLLEVSQSMLANLSISDVLAQIQNSLHEVLSFDSFWLFWHDESAGVLRYSAISPDLWNGEVPNLSVIPVGKGIASSVLFSGQAELVNNAQNDSRSFYAISGPLIEHLIIMPVRIEGRIEGVFLIHRNVDPPFTVEEFENAQLFSSYLSLALQNARMFEQMKRSEQKYRTLFEESNDAVFISTPGGQLLDMNPAGVRMLGYTDREEILKVDVQRLYMNPEDRQRLKQIVHAQGYTENLELRLQRKDGTLIVIQENMVAERDATGEIVAYRGIMRDITERKRAEEMMELMITSARCLFWYGQVEDIGDDMIWKIQVTNVDAAQQLLPLNLQPGMSYTDAWFESKFPEDADRMDALAFHALRSGLSEYSQEFRCRRADGEIRWLFEDARIEPSGPNRWRVIGVCTDITERKRAEESLRQLNEQLTINMRVVERRAHDMAMLNRLGELLQVCRSVEEAYTVVANIAPELFPGISGALYMINASQNLVESAATWGGFPAQARPFTPDDCWALRRGRMHIHDANQSGLRCAHALNFSSDDYLCVPMMSQNGPLGLLHLCFATPVGESYPLAHDARDALYQLATTAAEHISLALTNLNLRATLRQQAIRDPLTNLFNRRYMEESLERELSRAMRKSSSLGIVMLDLDHFKHFNDTFGHAAGDTVLRELGVFLQANIRAEDIACRYGGEEFTLILPESSLEDTYRRAEQIREGVRRMKVQHRNESLGSVTLSLGVAAFPNHGETPDTILYAADLALYRAKTTGRDRVVIASLAGDTVK